MIRMLLVCFGIVGICSAQDSSRVRVGVAYDYRELSYQAESQEGMTWVGLGPYRFVDVYFQFRPHPVWFVGAEYQHFIPRSGIDYQGRTLSHLLGNFGGELKIGPLFSKRQLLLMGLQVDVGRTGGASFDVASWTWTRGASFLLTIAHNFKWELRLRGSYYEHLDPLPNRPSSQTRYRLVGFHVGLQYRLWKR